MTIHTSITPKECPNMYNSITMYTPALARPNQQTKGKEVRHQPMITNNYWENTNLVIAKPVKRVRQLFDGSKNNVYNWLKVNQIHTHTWQACLGQHNTALG